MDLAMIEIISTQGLTRLTVWFEAFETKDIAAQVKELKDVLSLSLVKKYW